MALDGVFERHPDLRGAAIELGASWVPGMLRNLDHAHRSFAKALVQRLWAERRAGHRETRDEARQATTRSTVREVTRATIDSLVAHPAVLRLVMRSRLDQSSPLGDYTRAELDITLNNLITALEARWPPECHARAAESSARTLSHLEHRSRSEHSGI